MDKQKLAKRALAALIVAASLPAAGQAMVDFEEKGTLLAGGGCGGEKNPGHACAAIQASCSALDSSNTTKVVHYEGENASATAVSTTSNPSGKSPDQDKGGKKGKPGDDRLGSKVGEGPSKGSTEGGGSKGSQGSATGSGESSDRKGSSGADSSGGSKGSIGGGRGDAGTSGAGKGSEGGNARMGMGGDKANAGANGAGGGKGSMGGGASGSGKNGSGGTPCNGSSGSGGSSGTTTSSGKTGASQGKVAFYEDSDEDQENHVADADERQGALRSGYSSITDPAKDAKRRS